MYNCTVHVYLRIQYSTYKSILPMRKVPQMITYLPRPTLPLSSGHQKWPSNATSYQTHDRTYTNVSLSIKVQTISTLLKWQCYTFRIVIYHMLYNYLDQRFVKCSRQTTIEQQWFNTSLFHQMTSKQIKVKRATNQQYDISRRVIWKLMLQIMYSKVYSNCIYCTVQCILYTCILLLKKLVDILKWFNDVQTLCKVNIG